MIHLLKKMVCSLSACSLKNPKKAEGVLCKKKIGRKPVFLTIFRENQDDPLTGYKNALIIKLSDQCQSFLSEVVPDLGWSFLFIIGHLTIEKSVFSIGVFPVCLN